MRLNYSNRLTTLMLASIVLMSITGLTRADEKLVSLTKSTLVRVGYSFDRCYLLMREADLEGRWGMNKGSSDEFSLCIEKAPASVKSEIDRLRSALARKPTAIAALKEYILTYRQLLARLQSPSTTLSEAGTYSAVLDGQGAKVIAEVEW